MSEEPLPILPARKTGRCANAAHRDGGQVVHLIRARTHHLWSQALCGTQPGYTSGGWDYRRDGEEAFSQDQQTCARCAKAAARLELEAAS